ncbi:uncharacterized protein LOC116655306 isoform X1 [Drosophila ananassae]|uniref:uncharacterized protein LOC6504246 isoform X1 n=1 Tax=Drosophila ananassae TaxID=7217 RepID=UPI0013A5E518|nr:uncharacterized protein LOC6504246 isoform X1 [Drosophila ananassae]XP_032308842.1 uncharacterized protein LOC116655306 isoform X1 [Drosophila ananassae]
MNFVNGLSTGEKVTVVAERFITEFLRAATLDPKNWMAKASHHFVAQCFHVVGLKLDVSVKEFSRTQDHPYPKVNPDYVFVPVPFVLEAVDSFFDVVPNLLAEVSVALEKDLSRKSQYDKGDPFLQRTHPMTSYIRLIIKWNGVVHSVCKDIKKNRYYCEPLTRISFSILKGMSKLLPRFANSFAGLQGICHALSIDVRLGILYHETCQLILTPMLNMFQENFRTFCGVKKYGIDFVYFVLTIQMKDDDCYIKAYEFLNTMIQDFYKKKPRDENKNLYLRIFTNELITEKFLAMQFEDLKSSRSKPLLSAILEYLLTLQNHVVSTECFRDNFHEVLLALILRMPRASSGISLLAANLYIKLSKRKYRNHEIVYHILEAYIKTPHATRENTIYDCFRVKLSRYLKELMIYFPELQSFEFHALILTTPNARIELSLISAQSLSIIFELHMAQYSISQDSRQQVHLILRCLPALVTTPSLQSGARNILYSIYSLTDFRLVAEHEIEALRDLEHFCLNRFLTDDTLDHSEFQGLFGNISLSAAVTGNELMHPTVATTLRTQHAQLCIQLNDVDSGAPESTEVLEAYVKNLRRIHSLLLLDKLPHNYYKDICESLAQILLKKTFQHEDLIMYGSESLALILVRQYSTIDVLDDESGLSISVLAQELLEFCLTELTKAKEDIRRSMFLFCSIIELYIGRIDCLTLGADAYEVIIESLITLPQTFLPKSNPLILECMPDMYHMFRELLKVDHIELTNNRIWKIVMQYQMPGSTLKYLDPELKELIIVLIEYKIETYVHCLSVILLKLNNDERSLKHALDVLSAHLNLIKTHASTLDSWVLPLIIFQKSLNLLIKSIRVRRSQVTGSKKQNRLLPLNTFSLLIESLRLEAPHFMRMAELMNIIKMESYGSVENLEIDKFIIHVSELKYKCEDEALASTGDACFEGKLLALPAGPLNYWQHTALETMENSQL